MAHVFDVQSLKEEHLSPAACHGAVSRLLGRRWSLQPPGELLLSLCLSCWSINLHLWKERAYLLGLGIGVPRWAVVSWSRAGSEKQAKPTSGRASQATIHLIPICQYIPTVAIGACLLAWQNTLLCQSIMLAYLVVPQIAPILYSISVVGKTLYVPNKADH